MGKIILSGLAQTDDPMFTGKVEIFSVRRPVSAPTAPETEPSNEEQQNTVSKAANPLPAT